MKRDLKKERGNKRRKRHHLMIPPTKHRPPPGAAPGAMAVDVDAPKPVVRLFSYGEDDYEEHEITDIEQIREFRGKRDSTWINVDGLGDAATLQKIANIFDIHPLALADVVNVTQRPKVEPYPSQLFIVTRMVLPESGSRSEQVSVFLGANYVLSFQERAGDVFEPIRDRIRHKRGKVRTMGPDFLAYLLLDAVIDGYFPVLDRYSDQLEEVEHDVLTRPQTEAVTQLHHVKRDLLAVRRAIWPQREAMAALMREDSPLISAETRLHLRDCYDHAVQIMDMVETYRELAAGVMDLHLSSVSNRMNDIMKVLTIIATIFIPLTFIAGVYGMNFEVMPELGWRWGYPATIVLMLVIGIGMLVMFRRRGWLSRRHDPRVE